ncbi:MAG: arsenate reductase ArsC [Clostridiales bacterium]|nr:arsenate reductase ArsC [Clostridiales bacterium]
MKKPKVAFVCVHNSCRSQIAEALGKYLSSNIFDSYSAGTETKPQINQDAVRLMKKMYQIDMEKTQHSKLLSEIPQVDIVITMGCNVNCPAIPCKYREDWGLNDPTGKSDFEFSKTIQIIHEKILELTEKIEKNILIPIGSQETMKKSL